MAKSIMKEKIAEILPDETDTQEEQPEKKKRAKRERKAVYTLDDVESINDITFDFIIQHVKLVGDEKWLKAVAKQPVKPDKNGKARSISYIEIRKAFAAKYLPNLTKEKKPTMLDIIDAL